MIDKISPNPSLPKRGNEERITQFITRRPQKALGDLSHESQGTGRAGGFARMRGVIGGTLVLLLIAVSVQGHSEGVEEKAQPTTETLRRQYQAGEYSVVIQAIEGGEEGKEMPSEPQALLYLGLSFLKTGARAKAIDVLQRYRTAVPGSEGEREVSQYLTLLLQEEARQAAKAALVEETQRGQTDVNAIAVFPFVYNGEPQYRPISRGLAAMIITDLSAVKSLRVVERIRLQALVDELNLSQTGLVDPTSAPRIGRLLGAGRILTGSIFHDRTQNPENELFRLDAVVTQTDSRVETALPAVSGELQVFYTLQKMLVFKILCGIGYCPEGLDSQSRSLVEKVHTRSFKAFLRYSEGLEYLDAGNYREARRAFLQALEEDPDFELARKALIKTPLFPMEVAVIVTGVEKMAEEGLQADGKILFSHEASRTAASRHLQSTLLGEDSSPENIRRQEENMEPVMEDLMAREKLLLLEPVEILVPPETAPAQSTVPVEIEVQF